MLFSYWWKKPSVALREPSLGPVFGIKVELPVAGTPKWFQWKISTFPLPETSMPLGLPTTLLAALIDNHIHHGNELGIDSRRITWKRVVDMNDRQPVILSMAFKEKQTEFLVKMALTSLWLLKSWPFSVSLKISLISKERLDRIIIGYNYQGQPVTAKDLKAGGPWQLSSKMPSIQTWCKPWNILLPSSTVDHLPISPMIVTLCWLPNQPPQICRLCRQKLVLEQTSVPKKIHRY